MLVTKRETGTGKVQGEFYGEKITADFSEARNVELNRRSVRARRESKAKTRTLPESVRDPKLCQNSGNIPIATNQSLLRASNRTRRNPDILKITF